MSADSIEAARLLSMLPAEVRDRIVTALRSLGTSPDALPPTSTATHKPAYLNAA